MAPRRLVWAPAVRPKAVEPDEDVLPGASGAVTALEGACRRALLDAWATVRARVDLAALADAVRRGAAYDADRLLLPDLQRALLRQVLEPRLATGYLRGTDVAAAELRTLGVPVSGHKQLTVDLARANPEAVRWAAQHAGELVTEIGPDQLAEIQAIIAEANAVGIDPDATARRIREVVGLHSRQVAAVERFRGRLEDAGVAGALLEGRVARYAEAQRRRRAQTIARTELVASANAGQHALWQQGIRAGLIDRVRMYKRWLVTDDERLEARCEALGEAAPIPIEQAFAEGVLHPPLHPNCRCAVGLVAVAAPRNLLVSVPPPPTTPVAGLFDGTVRTVLREAAAFWGAGARGAEAFVRDVGRMLAYDGLGTVSVNRPNPFTGETLDDVGALGQFVPGPRDRIELAPAAWAQLERVAGLGLRAARSTDGALAVHVAVHEVLHGVSRGVTETALDGFFEEGLVEQRARRVSTALIFGGRSRPSWVRTLGNYEAEVRELQWFERTFGQTAADALWQTRTSRVPVAARYLRPWLAAALARDARPAIAEAAGDLAVALGKTSDARLVELLRAGILREWATLDGDRLLLKLRLGLGT